MSTKTLLFTLLLVISFVPLALRGSDDARNPTDIEIDFWERRQDRDPKDFMSPEKLGEAYVQKTRETGDFAWLSKAEVVLKKALALKSNHLASLNWLSYTYTLQHRFKDAISLSESALKVDANDGFSYGVLGDCYLEMGDFDKCESNYVRAMELAPGMFSFSRWANLQFMRGGIPESIEFHKQALADAVKNRIACNIAWCNVQLGYMYFRIGNFEKAGEDYQAALEAFPQSNLALEYLAELRAAQGKYDESAELYEKALAITPRPETYQALGDMWAFANQPEKAKPLIAKAATLYLESVNRGNIHYFHHLAGLYSDSQKLPDEALRWAQRDYEIRKGVYACDGLAWAYYNRGQYNEAADAMKKALAFGTRDSHLYYHASMIYFQSGDIAASRAMVKKAAELNPNYNKFHAHR
ncbi:MAG TPA: tetratricopeptide repeat protein [Planctomycetota bacterium]|nr:tetratricopeptide repeat protein [Planctomycetota bacterium]